MQNSHSLPHPIATAPKKPNDSGRRKRLNRAFQCKTYEPIRIEAQNDAVSEGGIRTSDFKESALRRQRNKTGTSVQWRGDTRGASPKTP